MGEEGEVMSGILPELLKLAKRDGLTPLETAALNLAIAVLGGYD